MGGGYRKNGERGSPKGVEVRADGGRRSPDTGALYGMLLACRGAGVL